MKKMLLSLMLAIAVAAAVLYASPAALMASMLFVERQLAGLSAKQVAVGDLNIHYYEGGPADGETILMIHGFAANRDNWLRFARHLTDRYRVVVPDLPGFGLSSRPQGSYDVGTQSERLAAFADALGISQLHLIGNSMGGHIAALYASRYPAQVRSLALVDNAGVQAPQKSELYRILERGEENPLVVKQPEDFARLLDFVFVEPPLLPDTLKRHLAEEAMDNSDHYDQVFAQLVERYIPLEPELPKIQAPTLLLWGEQDRALHVSSVEVMQPLLQRPSVVIMPNTGHAPMLERPKESAEHYRRFLEQSRDGGTLSAQKN